MPNFELYDFMDAISPVVAFSEFGGIVNDLIAFIGCVKLTSSYEIIAECFFKKSTPKTMICEIGNNSKIVCEWDVSYFQSQYCFSCNF